MGLYHDSARTNPSLHPGNIPLSLPPRPISRPIPPPPFPRGSKIRLPIHPRNVETAKPRHGPGVPKTRRRVHVSGVGETAGGNGKGPDWAGVEHEGSTALYEEWVQDIWEYED